MDYKTLLQKIAHFQTKNPFFTIVLLLVFSIMIWGGVSQVKTQASLEKMMPTNIEEIEAFNILRDSQLGKDSIVIVLSIDENSPLENGIQDISDERVYNYLLSLENELISETDILQVDSFTRFILVNTSYSQALENQTIQNYLSNYISEDRKTTTLIVQSDVGRDDFRMNLLVDKIKLITQSLGNPPGVEIDYTGTPIIQQTLGEMVNKDRSNTQWISTIFVILITIFVFRSITSAIIPVFVVFLSVNWLYGTMGYAGLPISTLAGGVAAMVIGIGIDFAIHIMNKFKYERKNNKSIEESVELALIHTGSALTATSLTTIAAFLAFLVGVMPEMGRFGLLMAIGIFYSLIFSLFGLPALLVIEEKIIYAIKDKAKFGIEREFHLEENKK